MTPLDSLSPAQQHVVTHSNGPLLVVAGAGSGKTRALTYRCAHLIDKGVAPEQLLLSTFTKRATLEFRQRLTSLNISRVNIGTLHSVGAKLLRGYATYLGYPNDFRIVPTPGSQNIIKKMIGNSYPSLRELGIVVLEQAISRYKDRLITPEYARKSANNSIETAICDLYDEYQQYLVEKKGMDFSDLIWNSILLLENNPTVADEVGLCHILVDEFQDTNAAQFRLINLLLGVHRNLTAVGDIDQAIYSFRGADHQIMCNFNHYYPDATTLSLGENYRCPRNIVTAAAQVINQNHNRIRHNLSTANPAGEFLVHILANDETDEACKVVQQIHTILTQTDIPADQIAILYRTNSQSRVIADKLKTTNLPHYVTPEYSGDPSKDESHGSGGIQMMTVHGAKGTEYQVVFLVGVEENLLPHWRALNDSTDFVGAVEEERRLFYVGMTRAKKMLYLSSARNRTTSGGREVICAPSRFLRDIPNHLLVSRGR